MDLSLKSLLVELKVPLADTAIVWCDNLGAIVVATNPVLHSKFKHVELNLFFVREKVTVGKLKVGDTPTQ